MLVIGIVGGVASGKSLVSQLLAQRGATIIDGDIIGHEVLQEEAVRRAARERWGEEIFDADGQIRRPALAKIVFAPAPDGPRELAYLQQITHPRIKARMSDILTDLSHREPQGVAVLDAALLLEAGWDPLCDRVVFVDAPREQRLVRAQTRGWTAEQLAAREAVQMPVEQKRARADWVIDNSSTVEHVATQVERLWAETVGEGSDQ